MTDTTLSSTVAMPSAKLFKWLMMKSDATETGSRGLRDKMDSTYSRQFSSTNSREMMMGR